VRWLRKDDTTFYMDEMEHVQQWQYYISSYMRIEHTEGVVRSRLQKVLLERNLPLEAAKDSSSGEEGYAPKPMVIHEGLVVRICLNSSKMVFENGTADYFVYNTAAGAAGQQGGAEEKHVESAEQAFRRELRGDKLKEKMVTNNAWMKGLSHEEVQKANTEYQKWKEADGALSQEEAADVTMEG
jgi:paired amphipathic helix protein Sin3a